MKIALLAIASLAGWAAHAAANPPADAGKPLPSAEAIIQRVLEHSEAKAKDTNGPAWTYDKTQVTQKLDGDDKVKERTEKVYRVQMVQGIPVSTLVKVDGRNLTAAELQKESQREAEMNKGVSGRDPKKSVAQREALITTNLVDAFKLKTERREEVHGRSTVVVSFEPKPLKPHHDTQDELMSRIAGTVWVDEQTADVAHLEVHLTSGFSLGMLGLLGSVKDCRLELLATPMSDGAWLPEKFDLGVSARMFLSSVHFKMEETSTNYTLEPASKITRP